MVEVVVQILDETRQEVALSGSDLEKVVNADLEAFQSFFTTQVDNGSLTGPEAAIIKTYLWWKTHPEGEVRGT